MDYFLSIEKMGGVTKRAIIIFYCLKEKFSYIPNINTTKHQTETMFSHNRHRQMGIFLIISKLILKKKKSL